MNFETSMIFNNTSDPIGGSSNELSKVDSLKKPEAEKPKVRKRRSRKKWKKPKDKPTRPLSAYNLFFQHERATMIGDESQDNEEDYEKKKRLHRKSHGKVGFAEMARSIGTKWKNLPSTEKKTFEEQALKEKERYASELATWTEQQKIKEREGKMQDSKKQTKTKSKVGSTEQVMEVASSTKNMMKIDGINSERLSLFEEKRHSQPRTTIGYLKACQGRQQGDASSSGLLNLPLPYPSAVAGTMDTMLMQRALGLQHPLNVQLLSNHMYTGTGRPFSLNEELQMSSLAAQQRLQMQQKLLLASSMPRYPGNMAALLKGSKQSFGL